MILLPTIESYAARKAQSPELFAARAVEKTRKVQPFTQMAVK